MSALTPKNIIAGTQLTASAATYYAVPANTRCIVQKMTFANTTGTARTVTVYLIPSGGTASASNTVVTTHTVPANSEWICDPVQGHTLEAGAFIQALADGAAAVTIYASGLEVVS